ncbi:MAG: DUF2660 domain-containing protein [Alphaproteobacteria bacterium]|nr:DUF2660 domain-containing protein [Alphaproteobacteria bacterium]
MPISFDPVTILIVFIVGFGYYAYKKLFRLKIERKNPYIAKGDMKGQEAYDQSINTQTKFTKEQKLEISWLFLYEITEHVLEKFSEEDREAVCDLGRKMLAAGCGYDHVIEYGIKKPKKRSKLVGAAEVEEELVLQK